MEIAEKLTLKFINDSGIDKLTPMVYYYRMGAQASAYKLLEEKKNEN